MDGIRPVDPVKTRGSSTVQPQVSSHKSHPRAKFVEPLTPLHRLARFKEIRDRNLARGRNLPRKTSLAPPLVMDAVVNGVGRTITKPAKVENAENLSNGNGASSHSNSVQNPTSGNDLNVGPALEVEAVVDNVVEKGKKSPVNNGTGEVKENVIASKPKRDTEQAAAVPGPVETGNEKEAEDGLESEGDHESEGGSSLDVVGESSSESLDLQVSRPSSEEAPEKDPRPTHIPELAPQPKSEQPKVVTPEIVRKIRAGGRIAARRTLRGEHISPALKRKLDDDDDDALSEKKARDDGTASSPGWQFFSPSKSISKFWSPFRNTPKTAEPANEVDESMVVNFDDQSNIFDRINDETATTLIEESQEKPAPKWCEIM